MSVTWSATKAMMGSGPWRGRLPVVFVLGALLVLVAGGGFAALESDTVSSYWEGVWWALSLANTVGFVGETPQTTVGRLLSSGLMVFGFGLMAFTTAAIASLFVREQEAPVEAAEQEFERALLVQMTELTARLERIEDAVGARGPSGTPSPTER